MGRLLLGHLSEENASPGCEYLPSQRVNGPASPCRTRPVDPSRRRDPSEVDEGILTAR